MLSFSGLLFNLFNLNMLCKASPPRQSLLGLREQSGGGTCFALIAPSGLECKGEGLLYMVHSGI